MIKLEKLLEEVEQEQIDEASLKTWIASAAIGLGSLFNSGKAQTSDTLKLNMSTLFPSGKHIIRDESKLKEIEAQIAGFMSKDPTADYTFRITAMSSKVPDYDGEKANKPKVDPEFLPHERAQEVKEDLEDFVKSAKQLGAFKGTVNIQVQEKPGEGPDWHPEKGDKKDDPKFTKHQGVMLDVISNTKSKPDSTVEQFKIASANWETAFRDKSAVEFLIFYTTNESTEKYNPGWKTAGYSDVLIRGLKPERERVEKKIAISAVNTPAVAVANRDDLYSGEDYLVPYGEYNRIYGTTRRYTTEVLEKWKAAGYKVKINVVGNEINAKRDTQNKVAEPEK